METWDNEDYLFLRLEPGEPVITSLKSVARYNAIEVGVITSGVGMLKAVQLGFFCVPKDDYETSLIEKILDLSSIQGNITWNGDEPVPHVHMTMNDQTYTTYSGHIMEAWCHITVELFIKKLALTELRRIKVSGFPATRITKTPEKPLLLQRMR
jgi:predicted DNA-binding protein with PD1-like motif